MPDSNNIPSLCCGGLSDEGVLVSGGRTLPPPTTTPPVAAHEPRNREK